MFSFLELTPAILLLLVFLIIVTLYSLYVASNNIHRFILLFLGVIGIGYCLLTIINILGNPRPIDLNLIDKRDYYLISHFSIEGTGIYLWVLPLGGDTPLYFSIPWDQEKNKKIRKEINDAMENGGAVMITRVEGQGSSQYISENERIGVVRVPAPENTK